jgi:ERCC4-type nuclease
LYKSLKQAGINVEKRNLELGDIQWIARTTNTIVEEFIFDFIVERKKIAGFVILQV